MDKPVKRYRVTLEVAERERLRSMLTSGRHAARKLLHAQILLLSDRSPDGPSLSVEEVRRVLPTSPSTIERVRKSFVEEGLEAALCRKAPNRVYERILDGDAEARLTLLACSTPPDGRDSWSVRLLTDRLVALEIVPSVSASTVQRTLKKTRSSRG
jgi:hypothetical protein